MVVIQGKTAADIVDSVRSLVRTGRLNVNTALPPIRVLAADLGVNRNTVATAYAQLAATGVVEAHGRAGTTVRGLPKVQGEGAAPLNAAAVNLASGNPDPLLLPDWSDALTGYRPVLYGAEPMETQLRSWAESTMPATSPVPPGPPVGEVSVTAGAVDAVERLLAAHLVRGDAVAVEDPGFFLSVGTLAAGGYRPLSVHVDAEGMVVDSLASALHAGARAVICTSRAHNPTGASLTAFRADALRELLSGFPDVLVIDDDHFSQIAATAHHPVIPPSAQRWALVRSVSKFLGPDLRVALLYADPDTVERLQHRLGRPTWVSHLLQRTTSTLLTAPGHEAVFARARDLYGRRRELLTTVLAERGIEAFPATDGLNLWVPLRTPEAAVVDGLAQRGWAVRAGSAFSVHTRPAPALRVTTATVTPEQAAAFAADLHVLERNES